MLAVILATASLTFPLHEFFGIWSSGEKYLLEMSAPAFAVSEYGGDAIKIRKCEVIGQIGNEPKYAAHCDDGEDYTISFIDADTLEFDGIRFTPGHD